MQSNVITVRINISIIGAIATLTDKIISSESDLLGVCLFGTVQQNDIFDCVLENQKKSK